MAPSPTLFARLDQALRVMPEAALALFSFWTSRNGAAVRQGALAGARWVRATSEYTPSNALVLPAEVATAFVAYARRKGDEWPDDVLMHHFLRAEGIPVYVAVPNLVEHAEMPSLHENDDQGLRLSSCYLQNDPLLGSGEDRLLHGPDAIPFFLYFSKGTVHVAIRSSEAGTPTWQHVPCAEYLRYLGLSLDRVLDVELPYEGQLDDGVARSMWLTGYLMGLVNQVESHGRASSGAELAVADAALRTVGPGGLSQHLGRRALAQVQPQLDALVRLGLSDGFAARVPAVSAHPVPPRRSVVVVGGGFVTRYLASSFRRRGIEVTVAGEDALSSVDDLSRLLAEVDSAVYVSRFAWTDPAADGEAEAEMQAAATFAKAAADSGLSAVVCLSSAGAPDAEALAMLDQAGSGTAVTVLRLGMPYGPGMPDHSVAARLIRAATLNEPIALRDADLVPARYVHVKDIADAAELALLRMPHSGTYQISNHEFTSLPELISAVGRSVRPVKTVSPPTTAAERLLGWQPTVTLDYGLHTHANWLAHDTEL